MPIYALGDERPRLPADGRWWVAPNAVVIGRVTMDEDASVWFGATVRGDVEAISIGARTNVQDGSVLHADPGSPLVIGPDVTVGHLVMLHGCTIGANTLIGIGSIILNGAKIGKNCLIGANTLIAEGKEIPDNSMVLGSPGRVVREVSAEMAQVITLSARHYVENWQRFRGGLKAVD